MKIRRHAPYTLYLFMLCAFYGCNRVVNVPYSTLDMKYDIKTNNFNPGEGKPASYKLVKNRKARELPSIIDERSYAEFEPMNTTDFPKITLQYGMSFPFSPSLTNGSEWTFFFNEKDQVVSLYPKK
jgi:hypothetical protein